MSPEELETMNQARALASALSRAVWRSASVVDEEREIMKRASKSERGLVIHAVAVPPEKCPRFASGVDAIERKRDDGTVVSWMPVSAYAKTVTCKACRRWLRESRDERKREAKSG